jgi:hypothetical protein
MIREHKTRYFEGSEQAERRECDLEKEGVDRTSDRRIPQKRTLRIDIYIDKRKKRTETLTPDSKGRMMDA